LQFAIINSSKKCVEWLLEAGADPNGVPDGEYGTPLQAAVGRGKEELVHVLLKRGASINPERLCGRWGDPLCAAMREDLEPIANILLDNGASLERTGKNYTPPLQVAAGKGFEPMVRLLISKGAKVNAVGGEYGTALRAALANGHEEVAKHLLDNGADIMQRSEASHYTSYFTHISHTYTSAPEVAVASNKTSTVQLLLDHGLDLNQHEEICAAAIWLSVQVSGVEMLNFMIQIGANVKRYGGKAMCFDSGRRHDKMLEKTKILMAAGVNIAENHGEGRTALGTSIGQENWEYMDFLLDAGVDPNAVHSDITGSALNEAIDHGNIEVVKKLLAKGADINLGAGHYGTPFVNAIASGDEELYHLFIVNGAIINPPEPYGYYGNPIEVSVSKGYYDIAHDLLDRGANIHLPGDFRSILTPACMAGGVGQVALFERLLSLGADIEGEDRHRPVDDEIIKGMRLYLTPLQAAARSDREDLVTQLLDKGASINPVTPQGTYGNPLQAASRATRANMVRFLLSRGADVNAVGGEYGTALQAAISEHSEEIINILLDAGADPSIEGGYYGSALQAAARLEWKSYVQMFLDRGVAVNTNAGKYGSALAAAAKRASMEVVKILLAHGANVNQMGGKYGSPLQAACCAKGTRAEANAEDIIQLLIEKGADVNTKEVGKYGSALQAAVYHNRKYARLLLKQGADPNAQGGKFGSPLKAACEKKWYRVEKELLDHGATPLAAEES
jgi:ankyrin repeat protein